MNSPNPPREVRAGITVQRSGKSCGSWSKTVDNSMAVNIAITHTGEAHASSRANSTEQRRDYAP
jgi:hypothetical protein